jgi:hypothetical protein
MNIEQLITRKKETAAEKIRAEFWKETPDPERIADCAIQGGMDAAAVAVLEHEIDRFKSVLIDAIAIDLSALKEAWTAADDAADVAFAALDAANAAAEQARFQRHQTEAALAGGKEKIDTCAAYVRGGKIPRSAIPKALAKQLADCDAAAEKSAAIMQRRSRIASLKIEIDGRLAPDAQAAAEWHERARMTAGDDPSIREEKSRAQNAAKTAAKRLADARGELTALLAAQDRDGQ